MRILRIVLRFALLLIVVLAALFVVNGLWLADGEEVVLSVQSPPAADSADRYDREVRVVAFNIAKFFVHQRGVSFDTPAQVRARLQQAAELIRGHDPDLVFLSEAVLQCSPCPVNQVEELADEVDLANWAFGENYNFGLPFYRIVGGNAILSRWPLEPVENQTLAGRQPFWVTKNNRRALWCRVQIHDQPLLLCSVHNDSFHLANNRVQAQQLLDFAAGRPALLAGDFNARPSEPPMQLLQASGQFSNTFTGPLTFPADEPNQKIDFILAPNNWEVVSHDVTSAPASDHCAVLAVFRSAP